jgi:hypothetical protein
LFLNVKDVLLKMEELANIGFSTFISAPSWYPVILGPRQIFTLCEVGVNPRVLRLVYNWYETGPYYLQSGVRAGIASGDTRLVCSSIPVDIPIPYTLVAPYIPLHIPQMFSTRPSVATQFTHWYAWQYLPDFVFFLGLPSHWRCTWPDIQGLISGI